MPSNVVPLITLDHGQHFFVYSLHAATWKFIIMLNIYGCHINVFRNSRLYNYSELFAFIMIYDN